MSRVDQYRITVTVTGVGALGTWIAQTGGQTVAEETKLRLGAMEPIISLGGPVGVDNVIVRRVWDAELRGKTKLLRSLAGRASMTIAVQPLDDLGAPSGSAEVYRGILLRVTPPDMDANATDAAMLELECSTHGTVA